MTLYLFKLLSPEMQLHYVLTRGTYLAQRWAAGGGVNLYHLPDEGRGFFAEVGYDEGQQQAVVLRSFSNSVPLENYAQGCGCRGNEKAPLVGRAFVGLSAMLRERDKLYYQQQST